MTFDENVWELCSKIPRGRVTTYKIIAEKLGTRAYRAVGRALHRNPYWPKVPCHRVVGTNGTLVGFARGLEIKRKLLIAEGVSVQNSKVDMRCIFEFNE